MLQEQAAIPQTKLVLGGSEIYSPQRFREVQGCAAKPVPQIEGVTCTTTVATCRVGYTLACIHMHCLSLCVQVGHVVPGRGWGGLDPHPPGALFA